MTPPTLCYPVKNCESVKLPRTFAGVWAVMIAGTLVLSAVFIALIAVFTSDGGGLVRQHLELGDVLGLLLITGMMRGTALEATIRR